MAKHHVSAVQRYLSALAADPLRDDLRLNERGAVIGRFHRCDIGSAFQPIVEAATGRPVAALALARIHGPQAAGLSPWNLFQQACDDVDLVLLDRRCRVVHTLNFFAADPPWLRLHLCVHDRLLSAVPADHGRAFARVLDKLAIPASRVVIVLPTLSDSETPRLAQIAASYQSHGFHVAVSPADPAQLAEILELAVPEVVRLDAGDSLAIAKLPRAVALARAAGAQVVVRRIDSAQARQAALEAGAHGLQGHLLAPPIAAPLVTREHQALAVSVRARRAARGESSQVEPLLAAAEAAAATVTTEHVLR